MPPLFIAGGVVPPFYLFVVGMALLIGLTLWLVIDKTRLGKTIRAAAENPNMVAALGINTGLFVCAGLCARRIARGICRSACCAGALADAGHGILGSYRVVHCYGHRRHGLDRWSIRGRACDRPYSLVRQPGFPLFTDGLMYLFMVVVLIAKPTGLFGKEIA